MAALATIALLGLYRAWMIGIVVTAETVVIRNPLRTVTLRAKQISRIEVRPSHLVMGDKLVYVTGAGAGGRPTHVWASLGTSGRERVLSAVTPKKRRDGQTRTSAQVEIDNSPSSLVEAWKLARSGVQDRTWTVSEARLSVLGFAATRLPLLVAPAVIAGPVWGLGAAAVIRVAIAILTLSVSVGV